MKLFANSAGTVWMRAILVVGGLLSLCISDSAGPRLLPLPLTTPTVATSSFYPNSNPHASRIPGPNREPTPHFEMVGAQYRARDGHHQVQLATHAPQTSLQLQLVNLAGTPSTYAPLDYKALSLSIPSGRAPPQSV